MAHSGTGPTGTVVLNKIDTEARSALNSTLWRPTSGVCIRLHIPAMSLMNSAIIPHVMEEVSASSISRTSAQRTGTAQAPSSTSIPLRHSMSNLNNSYSN